jgi:hypothetical protein
MTTPLSSLTATYPAGMVKPQPFLYMAVAAIKAIKATLFLWDFTFHWVNIKLQCIVPLEKLLRPDTHRGKHSKHQCFILLILVGL